MEHTYLMKQPLMWLGIQALLSTALFSLPTSAQGPAVWQKARSPLVTRWYDDVSPTNALPEYPRPQMTRADWQNLNGLWQFAPAAGGDSAPFGRDLPEQILVPFPVESALSGVMRHESKLWYRRAFDLPPGWAGQRILLHFGAVDWQATVYVNSQQVGAHTGGYDAFTFDITDHLNAQGPQELVVYVEDPTDQGGQPRGKQILNPGGIWYTAVSGIWQTVWLEPVAPAHIDRLQMTPDVDAGLLRLTVEASGEGYIVRAVAANGGVQVAAVEGAANTELQLPIPDAHLWSPDDPFLYDLSVSLVRAGQTVDEVGSYFGMRKIALGNIDGVPRILLNDRFVFQIGPLDQGFWPDGIYTAPTDDALKSDLEFIKSVGWNMVRKHIKVEPDRCYYWADKLGLLVWQDMPSTDTDNKIPVPKGDFEMELRAMIDGRRNHPSIVVWVVFNEGWGQAQWGAEGTRRMTDFARELDSSRIINSASGWTDHHVGDLSDIHKYVGPEAPPVEAYRAAVLGEFGGLGLHTQGHEWNANQFAYEWQTDSDQLTRRYLGLIDQLQTMMRDSGLNAAVYTEITDVEEELNGFLTYDRAVTKLDVDAVASAHRRLIEQSTLIE